MHVSQGYKECKAILRSSDRVSVGSTQHHVFFSPCVTDFMPRHQVTVLSKHYVCKEMSRTSAETQPFVPCRLQNVGISRQSYSGHYMKLETVSK